MTTLTRVSKLVLGKTAAALLLRAAAEPRGVIDCSTRHTRRGVEGGREADAAEALVAAGLFERFGHAQRSTDAYGRGRPRTYITTAYRITEAGRAALAGRTT